MSLVQRQLIAVFGLLWTPLTVWMPLTLCAALLTCCPTLWGDEPSKEKEGLEEISYYRQIRPLFQQHCQGCHQPAKEQGGFVMTDYASLLKPGNSNKPGIVVGHPESSLAFQQITSQAGKPPAMPKGKDPLIDHDVNLIRRWIAQGAKD